jgi:hypothetical protein
MATCMRGVSSPCITRDIGTDLNVRDLVFFFYYLFFLGLIGSMRLVPVANIYTLHLLFPIPFFLSRFVSVTFVDFTLSLNICLVVPFSSFAYAYSNVFFGRFQRKERRETGK